LATRSPARTRPLSPHLQIYKWGPHMLVSIIHRATGIAMGTLGIVILTWWLASIAGGQESYARFVDLFTVKSGKLNIVGWLFGIGYTLVFFLHMSNGIRHLVMDTGANFELRGNKRSSMMVLIGAVVLTAAFWLYIGIAR
jgi:succinate dehydrogenase / fumarate reductase, cytochrome b subunit